MATVTPGIQFISGETVTPAKLNAAASPVVAVANDEITTAKILDAAVTAPKLATGAVTGAAGGGKLAASAITAQTAIDALAADDELLVHDESNTALRKATWAQIVAATQPAGSVLQTVAVQDSTYKSLTWSSNWGAEGADVALVSTAGAEVLSGTITPSSASNKILVTVNVPAMTAHTTIGVHMVTFRGTTAIQASISTLTTIFSGGTNDRNLTHVVLDSPNTTSPVTYSVRVARINSNSGTIYVNGIASDAAGGGAYKAVLLMQEIKA
jgi:hypothetical protein